MSEAVSQTQTPCGLCSLVWNIISPHIWRLEGTDTSSVVLYRNPPTADPVQQIDVIVTREDKRAEFFWLPDPFGGLWHLGPPDSKPWLLRQHLVVYGDRLFSGKVPS